MKTRYYRGATLYVSVVVYVVGSTFKKLPAFAEGTAYLTGYSLLMSPPSVVRISIALSDKATAPARVAVDVTLFPAPVTSTVTLLTAISSVPDSGVKFAPFAITSILYPTFEVTTK